MSKIVKRVLNLIIAIIVCLTPLIAVGDSASEKDIEGVWQGVLKVSGTELRIVFKISQKEDGTLTAAMDSPDQGATDIPVSEVTLENGNLRLDVKSIMGVYEGSVKEDGLTIEGEWKQGGLSLPLVLSRIEKAIEIHRPQEPKEPYPYKAEEVVYENRKSGVKLAGTLTLPHSRGPFPAVLLISGSGPQDRNETVFGHRPFLVLADYLTRQGVAVLRVDDRGVGSSTGDFAKATSEDFADDVLAGIKYLKNRKEVKPGHIGLIGHSEGGIIAPMVATQSQDVAFIVLMAGTCLTGEEILYLQGALIGKAEGADDKEIARHRAMQERLFTVLKEEKDNAVAEKRLREILTEVLAELSEEEREALGDVEAGIESQLRNLMSPWFKYFLTYDPKPTLTKVKCPVLAINGEKDLQVPSKENLGAIEDALKAGGNKHYTIKKLSGLNHLFQTAQTGAVSEYAKIEETISPSALTLIADWILKETKGK